MTDIELLNDIKIKLNEIGVRAGDTVYVASDITGLLYLAKTECDVKIKQRDDGHVDDRKIAPAIFYVGVKLFKVLPLVFSLNCKLHLSSRRRSWPL